MISSELIEKVKERLIKAYDPLEIYLFGSYAYGAPNEESDLDLFIIVQISNEKSYKRPLKGYDALMDIDVPNDIIVYTKKEFDEKSIHLSTLAYKVKNKGKKLYAKA